MYGEQEANYKTMLAEKGYQIFPYPKISHESFIEISVELESGHGTVLDTAKKSHSVYKEDNKIFIDGIIVDIPSKEELHAFKIEKRRQYAWDSITPEENRILIRHWLSHYHSKYFPNQKDMCFIKLDSCIYGSLTYNGEINQINEATKIEAQLPSIPTATNNNNLLRATNSNNNNLLPGLPRQETQDYLISQKKSINNPLKTQVPPLKSSLNSHLKNIQASLQEPLEAVQTRPKNLKVNINTQSIQTQTSPLSQASMQVQTLPLPQVNAQSQTSPFIFTPEMQRTLAEVNLSPINPLLELKKHYANINEASDDLSYASDDLSYASDDVSSYTSEDNNEIQLAPLPRNPDVQHLDENESDIEDIEDGFPRQAAQQTFWGKIKASFKPPIDNNNPVTQERDYVPKQHYTPGERLQMLYEKYCTPTEEQQKLIDLNNSTFPEPNNYYMKIDNAIKENIAKLELQEKTLKSEIPATLTSIVKEHLDVKANVDKVVQYLRKPFSIPWKKVGFITLTVLSLFVLYKKGSLLLLKIMAKKLTAILPNVIKPPITQIPPYVPNPFVDGQLSLSLSELLKKK
jgi:hypothetical protein